MIKVCYLLHYEHPIGNLDNPRGKAQHYLGYTDNLQRRLADHRTGSNGSALTRAFNQQGIGFTLARTWLGDRTREKKLKRAHNHPRLCPICKRNQNG